MHVLFLFSIILVIVSSTLLTLIFENKKIYLAGAYFFGILFGQIVLTFQILSMFSAIIPVNVLIFNIIFALISVVLWNKKRKKPDFKAEITDEIKKFKLSIKRDKRLKWVAIAFLLCIIGSVIFMYVMPSNDEDAFSYHIARLPFWYAAKNLNHFVTADIRALIMPINSEIFYFWAYSFIKSDILVRVFSFVSYLLFVISLRGFLKELNFSMRTFLWTIFAISAMQNVMFSIAGAETNIAIAAMMMASLYLFLYAVKSDKVVPIFFASLLYALAIGTKTPSLQAAPALLLISGVIAYVYKKNNFYKPLLICFGFIILNFIIFASYNYILNCIEFGNPLTSVHSEEIHRFYGGFKGFIANLVRYTSRFIDFSGFPYSVEIWRLVYAFSGLILALMGIQPDIGIITSDTKYFQLGNNFENMCALGVLGFLVFLPGIYLAIKKIKCSNRSLILGTIAIGFILNIIVLAASLGYMIFSIRFIMFFVMFAAPVMLYIFCGSKHNKYKTFISIIMIYTFTFSYYFYERRFSPYYLYIFYNNPSIEKFKSKILCANVDFDTPSQACSLMKTINPTSGKKNVLFFSSSGTNIYLPKHMEGDNFQADFRLLETTDENDIDWNKYDYIVVPNIQQNTNIQNINKYKKAVIKYNDGHNGKPVFYDFDPSLFANCVFSSSRLDNFIWLYEPESKITTSMCYFKHNIFTKHNYELVGKFDNYDKNINEQLNLYKNMNK